MYYVLTLHELYYKLMLAQSIFMTPAVAFLELPISKVHTSSDIEIMFFSRVCGMLDYVLGSIKFPPPESWRKPTGQSAPQDKTKRKRKKRLTLLGDATLTP